MRIGIGQHALCGHIGAGGFFEKAGAKKFLGSVDAYTAFAGCVVCNEQFACGGVVKANAVMVYRFERFYMGANAGVTGITTHRFRYIVGFAPVLRK